MAGISAAKRLSEHGLENILVLEGDNRIGGRVKDVQFGGIKVEVNQTLLTLTLQGFLM